MVHCRLLEAEMLVNVNGHVSIRFSQRSPHVSTGGSYVECVSAFRAVCFYRRTSYNVRAFFSFSLATRFRD